MYSTTIFRMDWDEDYSEYEITDDEDTSDESDDTEDLSADDLNDHDKNARGFTSENRAAALGFRPQKEKVLNLLLPYAHQLDEESNEMWLKIKKNLAKSIVCWELRPGFITWDQRLCQ